MLFLQPLYDMITHALAGRINHFALIKLIFYSLDKTLFYFLIFVVLRLLWLLTVRRRRSIRSEVAVWLFTFYFILLLMLTTFRDTYFPWQLTFNFHRNLSDVNLIFMKETFKLVHGASKLDFFYNSFGNIAWFVPYGLLMPIILRKRYCFWKVTFLGMFTSIGIEALQFILMTGVSDIDDVSFNVCGTIVGYILYRVILHYHKQFV
ncbi:glycopeptide antibiotics resistance protein [Lactobacillus colini]|uniref:Glycopeptide antibiotics resistance protein n=1 Tax=Lactobacillus colini TaxID=1819254 RepID=A0ABS4MDT7_9LACO|nr:VanZ family protein [Lactobacillus colini]MBP2057855.1 glycopeptide antibiotics resistance protein [Lactobacillus colini]